MPHPLAARIRAIPDFPKKGILFRDITPLLADRRAFARALSLLSAKARTLRPQAIAAVESRGFIFGAPLAWGLRCAFLPVRKPGKLPGRTVKQSYRLEYGSASVEMHTDALAKGARVLVVDDLLATGGTAAATVRLCRRLGGRVVGVLVLIELSELGGRARLSGVPVFSVLRY